MIRCRAVLLSILFVPALCPLCLGGEPAPAQRLTKDGRLKFSPTFINDGQDILYVDLEKPELYRLKKLNVATGTIEPLHKSAPTAEFEPSATPDGRLYAFLRTKGALSVAMIIRTAATGVEFEVPPGEGFSGLRTPAVSPDGARIAFVFAENGRQEIFTVDPQGKDRKALTNSPGIHSSPCYSPDGKGIAFSSTRDGNYEIYVMAADGGKVKRLTHSPYQDLRPRFSPDGKRIAFTSHRDGNAEIYVMNADGTGLQRATHHPERDDYAAWHPGGRKLVIVAERDGRSDLYLIDAPP